MDVRASLQRFEANLSSYTEDDPLALWDRYVRFVEMKLPAEEKNSISVVLDRLVEEFLPQTRYHNDARYINYCIKCASFYSEPINLYSFIYDKGVGNRAAVLYIAWAEQFEKQGHLPQADAVYQRGMENLAEPAELVLQQYRLFQARTLKSPSVGAGAVRNPLQDSQLTNQRERPREASPQQCSDPEAQEQFPADKTIRIISRSENAHLKQPRQGAAENVQFVSMYCVNELVCEGSEFCFEELRAQRYFEKLRQQEELREREKQQQRLLQEEQEVERLKRTLAALDGHLGPPNAAEGNSTTERQERGFSEGDRSFANLTAELKPDLFPQSSAPPTGPSGCWPFGASGTGLALQPGLDLNTTVPGALGLTLPNSSFQQPISETPEPAIPHLPCAKMALSGLEEAVRCDDTTVPFDFFPKPLPSEDPSPMALAPPPCPPTTSAAAPDTSQLTSSMDRNSDPIGRSFTAPNKTPNSRTAIGAAPGLTGQSFLNSSFNPFTSSFHQRSFREQDVPDGAASAMEPQADASLGGTGNLSHITPNTSLGLVQATPSRVQPSPTVNTREALDVVMDMFHAPTFCDDPFSSMAPQADDRFEATYRNDGNVSLLGRLQVVTPFAIYQDENDKENAGASKQAEKPQPRVLADIPVSKPLKQTDAASTVESMTDESMMWGARYNNTLAPCPNSTGDFALSAHLVSTPFQRNAPFSWGQGQGQENGPQAIFCGSEEKPYQCKPTKLSPIPEQSPPEEKGERSEMAECTVKPRGGGEQAASEAGRLGLTQCSLAASSASVLPQPTAALSFPEPTLMPEDDVMGSPARGAVQVRDVCMSPERTSEADWDVPMSPAAPSISHDVPVGSCSSASAAVKHLVANPWDEDLIAGLLSRLPTPLSCYPGFVCWDSKLPNISPKITLTMGEKSLHVDSLLGQGAFATVYQASDPTSSNRVVLKVQKPANPWEFYINTQLDQRLQPSTRHLFNSLYLAHIFHNGSVLLGELHSCGTLLNAVNLYKSAGEKVMPQPLVLYFTICILGMVEQLHSAHIVHADVKPDNFLLGERFLENDDLDPDSLEHGLTLIDLGQSIDMTLFPEGTAFTAKCLTSGFQCTEMLDGRPWNYQTDYFGIAGTVYCMIFGTYMKVKKEDGVWKTNGIFKRNPLCALWLEFFRTLLNIPDCSSLPCLRGLRSRLIAELQSSYSSKLRSLKSRLAVMLLDSKRSRR